MKALDCTLQLQCSNASLKEYSWRPYSFIGFFEKYPLVSPLDVCQSCSKRFYRPWGLLGFCTGPMLWPQHWG